jgi:hypothetical protein
MIWFRTGHGAKLYIAAIVSVGLLVIGFVAAVVFVRKMTAPLAALGPRRSREKGRYDLPELAAVSRAQTNWDGWPAFRANGRKSRGKRNHPSRQVAELQITIDRGKQPATFPTSWYGLFPRVEGKARKFREA